MKKITFLYFSLLFSFAIAHASAGLALPPVNDECATASWLTVNTAQVCTATTAVSLSTATVSSQPNTCSTLNGGDVWYQFTATSTAHNIALSGFNLNTAQPAIMGLYSGDCASLTPLYCSVNNVIMATGLTAGTVYKLRLFYNLASPNNNLGFTVCVTTPPAPSSANQANCLVTTINYSFESPPPPAPTTFPVFANHNAVQGWRTTASDQMMEFWVVPNYENVPSYDGVQFIELNANLVSGVYQDYATPQPTVFSYGFAHRGRQGTDTCQLLAGPPGGPYTPVHTATTGNTAWIYYTGNYTVPSGQTTTRFIFQSVSSVGGASVGNYLDAISFTANNGILSSNPYNMNCGTGTANVSAAGTGTWSAHADNPTATVIGSPTGNTTTITGFGQQGAYYYDWTTAYCTSTLRINYAGADPAPPEVATVTYCQGQAAVPLTAIALPGHTLNWYPDDGAGGAPVPTTTDTGTVTYYVSQTSASGCESVVGAIDVNVVNSATPPVTTFTLPATVCNDDGNVSPALASGFTTGGQFSGGSGLVINPTTGEIDMAASTPGNYTVTYEIEEDLSICLVGGSSSAPIVINDTPDVPVVTVTQPTCTVQSGTITVDSPLGAAFTYSLNNITYQSGTSFSGLSGGTYTVYVKGAGDCISQLNDIQVDDAPIAPTSTLVTFTQPDCSSSTGSITVNSPVGTGYGYSLYPSTTYQAAPIFTGLAADADYVVTIQSPSGCILYSGPIHINAAPEVPAVPTVTVTQPECTAPSGTIVVDSPLGANLTYSIDGTTYQAGTQFTGLTGGNYTVYVKADGVCVSQQDNIVINTVPVLPAVATYTVTQPNCASATGSISISAPLGTGYMYSVDGSYFQSGTSFTGLPADADYVVTVQNASGCISQTATIHLNAAPEVPAVPTVSVTQPECLAPSGTIVVDSPLGPALTYSIDGTNYQPGTQFTVTTGGTYTVYVKAAGVCISQLGNVVVNPVPVIPPVATYTVTQPNCSSATGTITVTAPVGTGYSYSIDGTTFQPSAAFTNLPAAPSYAITVQNASGCLSTTGPITLNAAPEMPAVASVTTVQPSCSSPLGSITVDFPANPGYTYSINGTTYQPGMQFSNVNPGTYTVYVKSGTGCVSTLSNVVINASPLTPPVATVNVIQPTCTSATGTITVSSPTGTGFTYSIDGTNFQVGTSFTNLAGGATYTITTKNAAGCVSTTSAITINPQPAIPAVPDVTVVQPVCDTPVGSISINSPVGTGYTYSINGASYQASTMFSNLVPADYTVYVKNVSGCVSQLYPVTVSAAALPPPVATLEDDHPDCTSATGTLTVLAPLGPQYEYSIDGLNFQSGTVFSGLAGGFAYSVTVRNPLGCTSITVPVAMSTAPVVPTAPLVTVVQPNCGTPGTITVTSPVGAGFMYSLNGITFQTNPVFTNPPAGNYTVTVKSAGGCTATSGPYAIQPGLAGPGTPLLSVTQTTCTSATGGILIVAPIGNGITYSIDGVTYDTEKNFPNLASGSYTIYVKAANGCIASVPVTINPQPVTPVPATALITPANCTTAANIVITSPLGAGYTFSIDGVNFQAAATFFAVPSGTYTITVKTAFGCTSVSTPYTVNPAPVVPALASVTVTQPFCSIGTGNVTVDYPTGPGYTYSIGGAFQAGTSFANVAPGSYVLTVQNADGCTSNKSIAINPPHALPAIADVTVADPGCGETKGTVTINSPTGQGLSYSINGVSFQTGTYFANLLPGTYQITVKNASGCTSITPPIVINNPPAAVDPGTITGGTEVCEGETLQLANTVTGGTWASSSTTVATISETGEITALAPGVTMISYTVPAAPGLCENTASMLFTVNGLPELDIADDYLCQDLTTGEYGAILLNTGLSAGYTFEWKKDNVVQANVLGSIVIAEPGVYSVTATNTATGCVGQATATIGVSSAPVIMAEAGPAFSNNQTISISTTGGLGNYEYSLDGGPWQSEPYFHNIAQGVYTVAIRDVNGCGNGQTIVSALNYPHFFSPNGDGEHDTWNITGLNNYTTEISIFDRYGKVIAIVKPGYEGWDGTFNGAPLPATDYWFVVKYRTNGLDREFKAHFSLIR